MIYFSHSQGKTKSQIPNKMKNAKITTTTNSKGINIMKKTSRIKTRIIAGVLSAITVFTTGSVAVTSASAAESNVEVTR